MPYDAGLLRSAKKSDIIRLKIQHCERIQNDLRQQRSEVGVLRLLCALVVQCISFFVSSVSKAYHTSESFLSKAIFERKL